VTHAPRKKRTRTYSKGQHPGLLRRNHPKSTAWAVDFDYIDRLSPADREWLGRFADAHYKADPRAMAGWDTEERRQAYRSKNSANRDLFANWDALPGDGPGDVVYAGEDLSPTPEYLDSSEYKAAREAFRDELPGDARFKAKPTRALKRAQKQLKALVPEGEDEP
jgi:hypothetical protein